MLLPFEYAHHAAVARRGLANYIVIDLRARQCAIAHSAWRIDQPLGVRRNPSRQSDKTRQPSLRTSLRRGRRYRGGHSATHRYSEALPHHDVAGLTPIGIVWRAVKSVGNSVAVAITFVPVPALPRVTVTLRNRWPEGPNRKYSATSDRNAEPLQASPCRVFRTQMFRNSSAWEGQTRRSYPWNQSGCPIGPGTPGRRIRHCTSTWRGDRSR